MKAVNEPTRIKIGQWSGWAVAGANALYEGQSPREKTEPMHASKVENNAPSSSPRVAPLSLSPSPVHYTAFYDVFTKQQTWLCLR